MYLKNCELSPGWSFLLLLNGRVLQQHEFIHTHLILKDPILQAEWKERQPILFSKMIRVINFFYACINWQWQKSWNCSYPFCTCLWIRLGFVVSRLPTFANSGLWSYFTKCHTQPLFNSSSCMHRRSSWADNLRGTESGGNKIKFVVGAQRKHRYGLMGNLLMIICLMSRVPHNGLQAETRTNFVEQ